MTLAILISFLLVSMLLSFGDGYKIKWEQTITEKSKFSKIWHGINFIHHILIVSMCIFVGGWIWGLIGFFVVWIVHNAVIALILGQKWYYVGTVALTDRIIRKLLPFINFDK